MKISYLKRERIYKNSNYECVYCEKSLEEMKKDNDYTLDHKIPVIKGGNNDEENLVISCRSCNSRKGTKTYNQYLKLKELLSTNRYANYVKEHVYFDGIIREILDSKE